MLETKQRPILCVDDTEEQRYVTTRILASAGYRVIEAASGAEALERMGEDPIAVVLDVKLPDMSGFEVCRRIKSEPRTASIPVLQMSAGFADPELRAVGLSGGADAYVLQPLHREELIALIGALIRSRESDDALRLMSEVSIALSESLDYAEVLRTVLTMLVPRFADNCFLLTAVAGWEGSAERVPGFLKDAASGLLLEGSARCVGRVVGRVVGQASAAPEAYRAILVPLSVRGERLGVLAFVLEGEGRAYTVGDVAMALDFASRSALALQNAMLFRAQQTVHEALVRSEKLAAAGRMAASMAHEINNPLEAITNLVFLISTSPEISSEVKGYAEEALGELGSLAHITRQTLGFYQELAKPVRFTLAESVDEAIALYARRLEQKQIAVAREFATAGELVGMKGEVRQVISNLLLNAVDAMPAGGRIRFGSAKRRTGYCCCAWSTTASGLGRINCRGSLNRSLRRSRVRARDWGFG